MPDFKSCRRHWREVCELWLHSRRTYPSLNMHNCPLHSTPRVITNILASTMLHSLHFSFGFPFVSVLNLFEMLFNLQSCSGGRHVRYHQSKLAVDQRSCHPSNQAHPLWYGGYTGTQICLKTYFANFDDIKQKAMFRIQTGWAVNRFKAMIE